MLGRDADRDLTRSLARRLAEGGPDAARLRAAVTQMISGNPPRKGGILAALRRSPLVGADLDLSRERVEGRDIEILMRYLLDTNIISNITKPRPSETLLEWMSEQSDEDLYIASLTVGEIRWLKVELSDWDERPVRLSRATRLRLENLSQRCPPGQHFV